MQTHLEDWSTLIQKAIRASEQMTVGAEAFYSRPDVKKILGFGSGFAVPETPTCLVPERVTVFDPEREARVARFGDFMKAFGNEYLKGAEALFRTLSWLRDPQNGMTPEKLLRACYPPSAKRRTRPSTSSGMVSSDMEARKPKIRGDALTKWIRIIERRDPDVQPYSLLMQLYLLSDLEFLGSNKSVALERQKTKFIRFPSSRGAMVTASIKVLQDRLRRVKNNNCAKTR